MAALSSVDERSWRLNAAALDAAAADWATAQALIRGNLARLSTAGGASPELIRRYRSLVDQGLEPLRREVLARDDRGQALRSLHPLAGLLDPRVLGCACRHSSLPRHAAVGRGGHLSAPAPELASDRRRHRRGSPFTAPSDTMPRASRRRRRSCRGTGADARSHRPAHEGAVGIAPEIHDLCAPKLIALREKDPLRAGGDRGEARRSGHLLERLGEIDGVPAEVLGRARAWVRARLPEASS